MKIIIIYLVVLGSVYLMYRWPALSSWIDDRLSLVGDNIRWVLVILASPLVGFLLMNLAVFNYFHWSTMHHFTANTLVYVILFIFPSFSVCALATTFAPVRKVIVLRVTCMLLFLFWFAFVIYGNPPTNLYYVYVIIIIGPLLLGIYWLVWRSIRNNGKKI